MYKGLQLYTTSSFVDKTIEDVKLEKEGRQMGLFCRWNKVNTSVGRYFRYGRVFLIAGRSGSCKSYILNMLRNDFLDTESVLYDATIDSFYISDAYPIDLGNGSVFYKDTNIIQSQDGSVYRYGINHKAHKKSVLLHFGMEMTPEDELIRTASNILGKSYGYLLSSEEDAEGKRIILTDEEFATLETIMLQMKDRREYYVTRAGTVEQMMHTVDYVAQQNPEHGLVISIDHSLLPEGSDDASIINDVAKLALYSKQKHNALVIILHQFNNEIEDDERIKSVHGHYPRKKDIYFVNKLWFACDNVITVHRPELLNISNYGVDKLRTKNLLHWQTLKGRFSGLSSTHIWFEADLKHGRIYERTRDFFR